MKNVKTYLFDLDGTVYDKRNGLLEAMTDRITQYMVGVLAIPQEDISLYRDEYFQKYGSTLSGLRAFHNVDSEEYLAYIHDVPLRDFISPDSALRQTLLNIPERKWIFTNADRNHAKRVLDILGISDLFEGILDVWAMEYVPKPDPWVYKRVLEFVGNPDPSEVVFFEDTLRNLKPASPKLSKLTPAIWTDETVTIFLAP